MSNRRMNNEQGTINRNEITSKNDSRQVRGRIFGALDRVLDKPSKLTSYVKGSLAGFFANQRRRTPKFTFETLEPRVLFAATALAPDEFVIVENAGGAGASAVLLGSGTTAGVAATVTTTDGGTTDTISSIAIDVSAAAGTSFTIQLAFSGISGQSPTITVVGLADGDTIDLQVFNEALDDGVGGGAFEDPTGATSGFTASTEVVDADNGGVTAAGIADGTTLTAAGNIGTSNVSGGSLNGGTIIINNTVTNASVGALTVASGVDLTAGGDLDISLLAGIDADTASVSGLTIVGPVTLGAFDLNVVVEADGGTGTIDIADGETIAIDGAGGITVNNATNSDVGNIALGAVTLSSTGGIDIASQGAANIGNVSIDSVTYTNAAGAAADINILPDTTGDLGNTTIGPVAFGSGGDTDISIGASTNENVGSVTIGAITNIGTASGVAVNGIDIGNINFGAITAQGAGAQNGSYTVTASGAGNIGTVSLGNITLGDAGDGSSGSVVVSAAGGDIGNVSINDVTLAAGTTSAVTVAGEDLGNIAAGSTWTINGAGSITFTATTGDIGTFGGTALDVDFGAAATGAVEVNSADGIGAVTFNSVDHVDRAQGSINFELDTNIDTVGPVGAFVIRNAGDDLTNNVAWGDGSTLVAEQGSTITIAGAVTGSFAFTAGDDDDDSIGAVIIGQNAAGDAVDNSDFTGSLTANDGIASLTLRGVDSQVGSYNDTIGDAYTSIAATINANVDGGTEDGTAGAGFVPTGALGDVLVSGISGQLAFNTGTIFATDFGNITITRGSMSTTLDHNIALAADRQTMISDIGNVTVVDGAITGGSFISDDGIGIIAVTALTPGGGDITLATINTDADGGDDGAAIGGGLTSITASGAIGITTLDSYSAPEATRTDRASNDIGAIQAGQSISIDLIDAGGDLPSITIVEVPSTAGDNFISLGAGGGMTVNGNVDTIATTGDSAGDNITLSHPVVPTNDIFIRGDLDVVDAGMGNLTAIGGINVLAGTTGSPIAIFTDSGVDYILAVDGTFTGGVLNYVATFPVAGDATLAIADIDGTTNSTDTALIIATRLEGTSYLAGDDSGAEWDLASLQETDDDQHSLYLIRVEGDLTGDIGADGNLADGEPGIGGAAGTLRNFGTLTNVEIQGQFGNLPGAAGAEIYALNIGEVSYGSLLTGPSLTTDVNDNSDGVAQDLEIYNAFASLNALDVVISIPDGGSITKTFVGPNGTLETIRFTDTDGADSVISTVVIDFVAGFIGDIHVFGENVGIEYNAADHASPATNSNTNIIYGVDQGGVTATNVTEAGENAIDFIEFSSVIGTITTTDLDTTDAFSAGVGSVLVGYLVALDGASDVGTLSSYINNVNTTGVGKTLAVANDAPVHAGLGNISVDGGLGNVVTSGGVGDITTTDTITEATPAPSAGFAGLVTDGSAGAINIAGSVAGSLVVGDVTVTSITDLGTDLDSDLNLQEFDGDETVVTGILGTPGFTADINVAGSLGSSDGRVTTLGTDPASPANIDGDLFVNGQRPSISGDEISAPDDISVNITAGEELNAAIVSGKRAAVALPDGTFADAGGDITGNITASEIFGDIWAGGSIGTDGGGQQIVANGLGSVNAGGSPSGNIGDGSFPNRALQITATGGSAGNIYSNILSAGDMVNLQVIAGSGTGGSILGNIVAGTDGSGSILSTNINSSTLSSQLLADNDIGNGNNTNVVSAADDIEFNRVHSGRQTYDDSVSPQVEVTGPGSVNSDFLAGTVGGLPVVGNVNSDNLPIFDFAVDGVNQSDDIEITVLQAGQQQGNLDNHINGTLVASADIYVGTLNVDGNAIGNDGVAGGHIAAAGMGAKHSDVDLTINSGTVQGVLFGTFSAGMFVPFDNSNASPLNPADTGPLQAGTVLVEGDAYVQLNVGQWNQSATGVNGNDGITLEELLAGTESGANSSFAPTFSIGATDDVEAYINVVGLPTDANVNPDPASGNAVDVSIAAFADVEGDIVVDNTGDFNLVMANIDAVTAIGGSGNPSSPNPLLSLNDGTDGDLLLNITSNGAAEGGLDVEYFLAGFDYFTRTNTGAVAPVASNAPAGSVATAVRTPSFWESFGTGDIEGDLTALDGDTTDGWEAGDLSFALIAAGHDINGELYADDDIIARFGSFETDGSDLFRGGVDADIVAGASGNSSISPFGDGLFPGGDINGSIIAGDDILKQATIIPGTPDTIVETVVTDTISQNLAFAAASGTLVFDQFDASTVSNPTGGVIALANVAITANGTVTEATATFTNITAAAVNGTASTQVSLSLTSSFFNPSPVVVASVGGPVVESIPAGGTAVEVTVPGNTQAFPVSPAAPLSQFAGAGTFDVDYLVTASGTALIDGVGNSASITNPGGTGDVTVTYTYSITTTTIIPGTPDQVIGDQIVNIGAIGSEVAETGNVNGDIRSGVRQQLNGPDLFGNGDDEQGDIFAFIVAGDEVNGNIDAGDVNGRGRNAAGNFTGGVWAGAGVDLDIFTTADNSTGGDIDGSILTGGFLNVSDSETLTFGIYAEDDISLIEVGYGITGGDLLGNVIAEGDIDEIEIWGDLGAEGVDSIVAAGGHIGNLGVGNSSGIVDAGFDDLRDSSLYTNTFGTLYADVFIGGYHSDIDAGGIYIGGEISEQATIINGFFNFGLQDSFTIGVGSNAGTINFNDGLGRVFTTADGIVLIAVGGEGGIDVSVTGLDLAQFIAGDDVDLLHVVDGSVGQVIANDDHDLSGLIDVEATAAVVDVLQTYPFFTASLPNLADYVDQTPEAFGDSKYPVNVDVINVEGNIGVAGTTLDVPLDATNSNAAIFIQGDLLTSITSEAGSVGNVVIGGSFGTSSEPGEDDDDDFVSVALPATITGYVNVGDVYVTLGGFTTAGDTIAALTGNVGIVSTQGDIDQNLTVSSNGDIGGLISRNGSIAGSAVDDSFGVVVLTAPGSIGLLQAASGIAGEFTAQSGSIGSITTQTGNIAIVATAGTDIGPVTSTTGTILGEAEVLEGQAGGSTVNIIGETTGSLTAGGNIGPITAAGDIGNYRVTAGGNVGDITSQAGSVGAGLEQLVTLPVRDEDGNLTFRSTGSSFNQVLVTETVFVPLGRLMVVAGGNIGGVSALVDVDGEFYAGGNIGNVTAGANIGSNSTSSSSQSTNLVAIGSIGNITAQTGFIDSLVVAHAQDSIGNLRASLNVGGEYVAEEGSIGTITSAARDINVNASARTGIGNVEAGRSVFGDYTVTAGPIGSISALTGNIGSASDRLDVRANGGVELDLDRLEYVHVVNGTMLNGVGSVISYLGNIYANITTGASVGVVNGAGDDVTGGIAAPIGDVHLGLHVGGHIGGISGGNGVSIDSDSVILGSIGIIRGAGQDGGYSTTVGGVSANNPLIIVANGIDYRVEVASGTASVSYTVSGGSVVFDEIIYTPGATSGLEVLTVDNQGNDVAIQTHVESLTVNGDLESLRIDGSLGDAYVTGDIVAGADIVIESGEFRSLEAGGTNFGLQTIVLNKDNQTFSYSNSLSGSSSVVTVYIGKGDATLIVNNGLVESIELGNKARDFAIVVADAAVNPSTKGAIEAAFNSGAGRVHVDELLVESNANLRGIMVEGDLDRLFIGGSKGSIQDVQIKGDLGTLFAAKQVRGVHVQGNAGVVDGGTQLRDVQIDGSVDVLKATKVVQDVTTGGNAGIVSAGGTLKSVFIGGSSISVGAGKVQDLQIVGSVGLGFNEYLDQVLGTAFSIDDAARILGVSGYSTSQSLSNLWEVGDVGPTSDSSYLGGLQAETLKNTVVGGLLSDFVVFKKADGFDSLFNSTVDDANVVGSFGRDDNGSILRGTFIKVDGQIVSFPGLFTTAPVGGNNGGGIPDVEIPEGELFPPF